MPMASMATQTQMGERIKEELGSLLGPYPAKQRMNASLLNFSVFRDRYTKPLVSGQRVICTFPPPLGSAPRAALLSPAIMLSTGSCTRFLALQRIRKSIKFSSLFTAIWDTVTSKPPFPAGCTGRGEAGR